ncbi:MAG: glutamine-synthetase adenylyltransferase [Aquificae bacterium]|nr:glutamine-synthetase adenylyltransferase [Aquificota bacterium]
MGSLSKFETFKKEFLDSLSKEEYDLLKGLVEHSSCIGDFLFRHPEELKFIKENIEKPLMDKGDYLKAMEELSSIKDNSLFAQKLAFYKMRYFSLIVAKDINKINDLMDLTASYSHLADASFEVCYKKSWEKAEKLYGTPIEQTTGEVAEGCVIALGKLGGLDLNYFSDVDVMYLYSDEGKTTKGVSNREFFIHLFTNLTTLMTKRTFEGQPWIVDLDLRPEGKKGFLAYSLPAVEFYYWGHGRTWERHMLIKARHSAGSQRVSQDFLSIITPFVYRKIVGEEVFEEIVSLKKLIEEEGGKGTQEWIDVKKSEGGIREIEFTIQIFQLLYGGKNQKLQERRTIKALRKLVEEGIIPPTDGKRLEKAYYFLRKLEHLIQIRNCVQTQKFYYKDAPYYAEKMGYSNTEQFLQELETHRKNVREVFESLSPNVDIKLTPLQKYIITKQNEETALQYLKELGFKDPKWALEIFKKIFFGKLYIELSEGSKELLFAYLPNLEKQLKDFPDREDFLLNLSKMLLDGEMLWVFVSALEQNQKLVEFMLNIAKLSDYISSLVSKDRELLDWAFGVEDVPTEREAFEKELKVVSKGENFIDSLKKLKKVVEVLNSLKYLSRINTSQPLERLKEMNVSLSNLADFILEKLYQHFEGKDFAVYTLGKLGSREMNIGSDLDLVFVFRDEESKHRFLKIPQEIVKALTTYTKEGILYNVDLRLRPFGKGGELSPSLSFYKGYFDKEARSWERLAWVKSRFVVGEEDVKDEMERIINDFLFGKDIDKQFVLEAIDMRFRLEGLARETPDEMDIKLGKGGITDIEFLVQTLSLKEKQKMNNIIEGIKHFNLDLMDDYLFLREVEARLRMIKGVGMSKIYKNSPYLSRIAHSFGVEADKLWEDIKDTKNRVRDRFLREMKLIKDRV